MRTKIYGLLENFIFVSRYHMKNFRKSSSTIPNPTINVLYQMPYIGTVVLYTVRSAFLRKASLKFIVYALSIVFLYFLTMSFSDSMLTYNAVNNSSNVQISKESGTVSVAYENGTVIYCGANDADAIEAALNEIDTGCILFKKGIYSIDRQILLKSNISFIGSEGVIFNCFNGTVLNTENNAYSPSTILLLSNVYPGDTKFELSNVTGLRVGDYVKISDDFTIFDRRPFKNGELSKIIAIDGTLITVDKPLYDSYSIKNNAKIRKMSMFENIIFKNIHFVGYGINTDSVAICLRGVLNCKISNCEFTEFGERAVSFWDSIDCIVQENCFKKNFKTGFGYSIDLLNACDNITIVNNSFLENGRHYIAVGSGTGTWISDGLCRNIIVINNIFENSTQEAINTHIPTRSNFTVINNEFSDCKIGILFRNGSSVVLNNTFKNCTTGFISQGTGSHLIERNHFKENSISCYTNDAGSIIKGNSFDKCGYIVASSNLIIDNNTFNNCSDQIIYGRGTSEEDPRKNITISNNTCYGVDLSPSSIHIKYGRDIFIQNNDLQGCIKLDNCSSVEIFGNRINTLGSYGLRVTDAKGTFNIISNEIIASNRGISLENSGNDPIVEEINIDYNIINASTEVYTENYSKLILKSNLSKEFAAVRA